MSIEINDIITLSAIRAPCLTALITGFFQRKAQKAELRQKRIESIYLHKREVLENYIQALEECRLSPDDFRFKNIYYKKYGFAVLNVSKSVREKMERVNSYVQQHNFDKVNKELPGLLSDIADEITKSLK